MEEGLNLSSDRLQDDDDDVYIGIYICLLRAACLAHLTLVGCITLKIFSKEYT